MANNLFLWCLDFLCSACLATLVVLKDHYQNLIKFKYITIFFISYIDSINLIAKWIFQILHGYRANILKIDFSTRPTKPLKFPSTPFIATSHQQLLFILYLITIISSCMLSTPVAYPVLDAGEAGFRIKDNELFYIPLVIGLCVSACTSRPPPPKKKI